MSPAPVTVTLDEFEGPLDLLLELVKKQKVDITTISLRQITDDFLAYIASTKLSSDTRADFLLIAATLLLLKLRKIGPSLTEEEEQEVETLTERVREYQLFREKSSWLATQYKKLPLRGGHTFRPSLQFDFTATATDLSEAMEAVMSRQTSIPRPTHLRSRRISIQQTVELFYERLQRLSEFTLQEAQLDATRSSAIASLLAALELSKKRHITLHQERPFSSILIKKHD